MRKSRRFATGQLVLNTGTEGPRHDPYSYTEWTIERHGIKTVLHLGLGEWLQQNDYPVLDSNNSKANLVELFEKCAGVSLKTCAKVMQRILPCCANPKLVEVEGYPGESMVYCQSCDKVVDVDFDENAVI